MKAEKRGGACGFLDGGCAENLISKASKGDKQAFELLMGTYLKVIYNYIHIHVKNHEDIQDIVQETMLAVWSGLKSFGNNSSFRTWIIGIARRKICDYYRSKYKISTVSIFDVENSLMIEDKADDLIMAMDVNNAVLSLDSAEQELVFLVFNAQLTYQEISEITQIPVGTVKSKLFAIKSKLRKQLETE
jgi:RNA polymerase sigma-70 factor (ECF subfamily)